MKLTSLLPTLAALALAVTASAQSDPSVGGSFGTSFDRGVGSVGGVNTYQSTSEPEVTAPAHSRSFWDRMTGRNKSTAVSPRTSSNPKANTGSSSHSWWPLNRPEQPRTRGDSRSTTHQNERPTQSSNPHAKSSGWHIPFFSRH